MIFNRNVYRAVADAPRASGIARNDNLIPAMTAPRIGTHAVRDPTRGWSAPPVAVFARHVAIGRFIPLELRLALRVRPVSPTGLTRVLLSGQQGTRG
ncbi:MAG TPA: hypothetical protein VMU39_20850 [Solirubrobacteraceae bacterium]|nr:hypothetical protein [Solirubrobacteraceae bacterium]